MLNHILSILPLLIPGTCFVSIAIFYAIVFKRKIMETYFLSSATIIFVLFFSGLLNFKGSLLLGYSIIISFSLFSLIVFIKNYLKNRKIIKEIALFQGLIIMAIFFIFSLFLNYERMLCIWDELTHWGSALKNMYFLDALGTFKEASGSVGSYPPAASIFQYFWMRPFSNFTEFPAFIASNLLFFSLVATFLKNFNLRNIIFLFSTLLIPFLILPSFFTSIYVDNILGILFGCILLTYYVLDDEGYSFYRIIQISAIAGVLTLFKDMGLLFSGIACLIILIDMIFFQRNQTIKYIFKQHTLSRKIKNTFFLLTPILTTLGLRLIWSLHLKLTNAFPASQDSGASLNSLINNLTHGILLPYQYETINNFKEALTEKPLSPLGFSVAELFILLTIALIIIIFLIKEILPSKKRLLFAFFEMMVGGAGYIGLLLILYLSIFSSYEAVNLASYSRYILSYMIGIFFFLLVFILQESNLLSKKEIHQKNFVYNLKFIITVLIVFFFFHLLLIRTSDEIKSNIFGARESVHNTISIRSKYDEILIWKTYFSNADPQPYIISEGDTGFDSLVIIYTLYPIKLEWKQDYSVSLKPYFPELNDPWTKIFTPEEWEQYVLTNYKQVYIFSYDQNFQDTYGYFFDKLEDNTLYDVTIDESGDLKILSIPKP